MDSSFNEYNWRGVISVMPMIVGFFLLVLKAMTSGAYRVNSSFDLLKSDWVWVFLPVSILVSLLLWNFWGKP